MGEAIAATLSLARKLGKGLNGLRLPLLPARIGVVVVIAKTADDG